ncbi:hypothetical protein BB558_004581 [Smittium angustum]|uniref:alpha-1,2-Mannosidase n=1 Tax=Smittium angustum TaxID=133377 RepID=A0A2U1J326_SMIAN|nr:hypothetical protein BB558_004581 [Smittium angustum]
MRKHAVKDAMKHAWRGYSAYAYGKDEVLPVTKGWNSKWGGWGVTLIDSLDTLYIMGMKSEFKRARNFVADIDFTKTIEGHHTSVFETTIRVLGGLLGAYELSGDELFLKKAVEIADVLMPSFHTSSGIPYPYIDINSQSPIDSNSTNIAEIGTLQLEFHKLSFLTKNLDYYEKTELIIDILEKSKKPIKGLYPILVDINTKELSGKISVGARGDSFYESNDDSKMAFMVELDGETLEPIGIMEHLYPKTFVIACFMPGLLALGSKELNRPKDLELAKDLMKTCYYTYKMMPTGLGPESIEFEFDTSTLKTTNKKTIRLNVNKNSSKKGEFEPSFSIHKPEYILRPETVESLMILYRITENEIYQEWGWEIFSAIEKYTKTPIAYSAYDNVANTNKINSWSNSMESFFLGETLKYLYLLFSPVDYISLDKYVFNTEAHPLKIIK